MSRGLGHRQQQLLAKVQAADDWVPLHRLADDPDDPNEMAKARAAAHSLERRGMVRTMRDTDPSRQIKTTVITGQDLGFGMVYIPEETTRAWSGMWVRPWFRLRRPYQFTDDLEPLD